MEGIITTAIIERKRTTCSKGRTCALPFLLLRTRFSHFCTPRPIQARPLGKYENMATEKRGMGRAKVTKSKERSESERGRKRV